MSGDYPPVAQSVHHEVVSITLQLSPGQANDLYNELYGVFSEHDVHNVPGRHRFHAPALYAVYDALHEANIDGTGPSAEVSP